MFPRTPLILAALLLTGSLPALADDAAGGCAAKQAAIQTKLDAARAHGNNGAIDGLQKALEETRQHCTDAGLAQKRKQRVLDAEKEVSQRQQDLRKAMNKGDQEKIDKRKTKLAEARSELDQAKRELGSD
ncbi:MAG: Protein YqjC [Stenotrophomonas maltophilia]|nr:MAG: Protein YqjC [Stenotrophomonas maltophilia]